MVFFESPHRAAATLHAMAEVFGADRAAAACRELTKTYEEVRRGGLAELAAWADEGLKGELTLVVSGVAVGAAGAVDRSDDELVAMVHAREAAGTTRKDAIVEVAGETGRHRREVYAAVVSAKNAPSAPE